MTKQESYKVAQNDTIRPRERNSLGKRKYRMLRVKRWIANSGEYVE